MTQTTRRDFLLGTATAAAAASFPLILPRHLLAGSGAVPPSEKIGLGVIGLGPRCAYDLNAMIASPEIRCLAVCDVQASRRTFGQNFVNGKYGDKDCQTYRDFRELLDRSDIDAVLIATGDRWHAAASILAAKAGKDVYSEKPCGITIELCQQLADTMNQEKRVFQAGTQRRSVPNFQKAVQLVHDGKLGKLHTMHASVYIPTLDNSWLPAEKQPERDVADWNLWLGPAPWRPFNQKYLDGRWRGQWDFDSGARILDWGAHTVDLCQWANKADDTLPVTYEPGDKNIVCHYANGVKLIIDFLPEPFGNRDPHYITRLGTCPVRFIGDEGSVETGDEGEIVVTPKSLETELGDQTEKVRGLDVSAHSQNFFECIRSREKTAANADVMRRSHLASHAAAIAWILQRKVTIDPVKEEFVNDAEANCLRSRAARDWTA